MGGLLTITVIAAPIGLGLMEYGKLLFWPFGNAMVSKTQLNTEQNKAWKTYSTIITILYFPFGLFLTICAIFQVIALCLSIIGIPAAMVVAKSLSTYLNPVNKKCVHGAVVAELERRKAQAQVDKHLGKPQIQSEIIEPLQQAVPTPITNTTTETLQTVETVTPKTEFQSSEISEPDSQSINIGGWFEKNKKNVLFGIGGLLGVLLLIVAIKFVFSLDFGKSKTDNTSLNETATQTTETSVQDNSSSSLNQTVSNNTVEQYQPGNYIANGNESNKIYFHNAPDPSTIRKAYLSTQEKVYVQKVQNGFGYTEFTNSNAQTSYGWIQMSQLIVSPDNNSSNNSQPNVEMTKYTPPSLKVSGFLVYENGNLSSFDIVNNAEKKDGLFNTIIGEGIAEGASSQTKIIISGNNDNISLLIKNGDKIVINKKNFNLNGEEVFIIKETGCDLVSIKIFSQDNQVIYSNKIPFGCGE